MRGHLRIGPSEYRHQLSFGRAIVGGAGRGNLPAALQSYQDSLAIRKRLARKDPGNARWQRDLALSHGRVATVLAGQGNRAAALDELHKGHSIIVRLREQSPEDATLPNDLAWLDGEIAKLEQVQTAKPRSEQPERQAANVYWHLADIDFGIQHVRFVGKSGHACYCLVGIWGPLAGLRLLP